MLRAANPGSQDFAEVSVWAGKNTLDQIDDRAWLVKRSDPLLDRGLGARAFWQRFRLSQAAAAAQCDVLFVPGGTYAGRFHPVVTMSRNLLPFEWRELQRYAWSRVFFRLLMLRWMQARTVERVDGLIFLTDYARRTVRYTSRRANAALTTTIPHGIHERFAGTVRDQLPISWYSTERPFRLLYVSIIDLYKHQPELVEAVGALRRRGLPLELVLVGPHYAPAMARLERVRKRVDSVQAFVRYVGEVPNADIHAHYERADLVVFASSCENMPNVLLEAMASGRPVACSNRGPMPEVLGDAGVYFDPEDPDDIARALDELIAAPTRRLALASAASIKARAYSWERCARDTFAFLSRVATSAAARGGP